MIECKTEKGVISPAQVNFKANWIGFGGEYILVRSLDELIEYLKVGIIKTKPSY